MTKINPFLLLVSLGFILFILFWIAKSIFKILSLVAPILFFAALIINYRVVIGYGKWIGSMLKTNPLVGVLSVILTIVGFPVVSMYLLLKAISSRDAKETYSYKKGEYIEYEEVNEDFLDISEITEHKKKLDNDYNDVLK